MQVAVQVACPHDWFQDLEWQLPGPPPELPAFELLYDPQPNRCLFIAPEPTKLQEPLFKASILTEWEIPDEPGCDKFRDLASPIASQMPNRYLDITPEPTVVTEPPPAPVGSRLIWSRMQEADAAVREGSIEQLQLALLHGHRCSKSHALCEAVRNCHIAALELLLQHGDSDLNEPCHGKSPLRLAVQSCVTPGDVGYKMAQMLLEHGASPDATCEYAGVWQRPALWDAVERRCDIAVELLLAHGADCTIVDKDGSTVLHVACKQLGWMREPPWIECRQRDIVETLLRHGADPTRTNVAGLTPAWYSQNREVSQKLARAMRWWGRHEFDALFGKPSRDESSNFIGTSEACNTCLRFTDVAETIASFL